MSIKAIWFDFGGVLSPTIDDLYKTYERKTGVNREQMEAAMAEVARPLGVHFLAPIELAMITQLQWAQGMREALSRLYPTLDISRCDFDRHGEQWFADNEANPAMIALVHEYKRAGLKVGILTNNVIEWEGPWRRMVGLDGVVDDIVDSCKVLVRKPDPRIFAISAERLGCAPEECVLIDDLPENCAAARASGWNAVVFRDNEQVTRELRGLVDIPLAA
jgi:putative hydrolase of the HAD superfamily